MKENIEGQDKAAVTVPDRLKFQTMTRLNRTTASQPAYQTNPDTSQQERPGRWNDAWSNAIGAFVFSPQVDVIPSEESDQPHSSRLSRAAVIVTE